MDPFTAILAGGISSLSSVLSGVGSNKQTPDQKRKNQLLDELMASLQGYGPYSDLFNLDQAAFQQSYVDPMKQLFSSQFAPKIQQSYIAGGQQRGSGVQDTLTRAGVNMDQLLNQQYASMLQGVQQNKLNALSGMLSTNTGEQASVSPWERMAQGAGGFLASDQFGDLFDQMVNKSKTPSASGNITPKGYIQ